LYRFLLKLKGDDHLFSKRTSLVETIKLHSVAFSSVFEVGDSVEITPYSRVFAVQREHELYYSNEGDFNAFPLFSRRIPVPTVDEQIVINRTNQSPFINVQNIYILGASASSVVQIGSTDTIDAESRVKNIRQLSGNDYNNDSNKNT
jgi:spore germination protein PE